MPDSRDYAHALALFGGLVAIGLLNRFALQAGYPTLGTVIWVFGYAALVVLAWYRWIRPLDLGQRVTDAGAD